MHAIGANTSLLHEAVVIVTCEILECEHISISQSSRSSSFHRASLCLPTTGFAATADLHNEDPFREIPVNNPPPPDLPNPDQESNVADPEEEFGREEVSGNEEFGPKEEFGPEEGFGPEEESGPETEADPGLEAGLVGKAALDELLGPGDEDADIRKFVADLEQRALTFPSIDLPKFVKTISSLRQGTLRSIAESISSVFKALVKIFDMVKVIRRQFQLVQGWISSSSEKGDKKPSNRPPKRGRPRAQKRQKSSSRSKSRDSSASHHKAQPLAMDKHKPLAVKPKKPTG